MYGYQSPITLSATSSSSLCEQAAAQHWSSVCAGADARMHLKQQGYILDQHGYILDQHGYILNSRDYILNSMVTS